MSETLIAPHGGALVRRIVPTPAAADLAGLPRVRLNARSAADLFLLGHGAFSPLTGFMGSDDYDAVVHTMHLAAGLPWSLPITLAVGAEEADRLAIGATLLLESAEGAPAGTLELSEKYGYDRHEEARQVYRTEEAAHPGVAAVYAQGDILLAGSVQVFDSFGPREFPGYPRTPEQTRKIFAEKGWRSVVAFQTRNPIHRAHEYIIRCAMEITDGFLLHPLVGETKSDDIPAAVRMACYEALLFQYFPTANVQLGLFPAAMRYAGPREAIFHALVRKNYGCSHLIVGRDHAGVGSYYGTYEAQRLFDAFDPAAIGITPLRFENTFWCQGIGGMASSKTTPFGPERRISLSGTAVRAMLAKGERPPVEFTRPEIADLLMAYYQELESA